MSAVMRVADLAAAALIVFIRMECRSMRFTRFLIVSDMNSRVCERDVGLVTSSMAW